MIRIKSLPFIGFGILLLALGAFLSLSYGARSVPFETVMDSLLLLDQDSLEAIVVKERIPRTIFGLIAGASLGVSGAIMQAITRNPIADPSILGVNTGASLFVVAGITFFSIGSLNEYIWFALLGAMITSIVVYTIGSLGYGGATPIKLALAGVATSAALSSFVSALVLPRTDVMNTFRFWQVGSISGATWEGIVAIFPYILIGLVIAIAVAPSLEAMALGDELATGLGVRTSVIRMIGAFSGIVLCGATTALAGPIGFIGLMVPHAVRLLFGPGILKNLPLSAIGGAVLLLLSDVLGRLIGSPAELETGIVTAFLGAPILIIIAMKARVNEL
ncbi:MAG TPA: iron ABC transporter [Eubacteriaceae bacterium]|nr:iron ABC transporter [Eubacteriaceae bacterium]